MAFSLLVHSSAGGTTGGTTGAIDTTGADLIVLTVSWYTAGSAITVSDSKSNTWTPRTTRTSDFINTAIMYFRGGSVGSGHTFTVSSVGTSFSAIVVAAFSGSASVPYDVENGAGNGGSPGTSLQTGNVTPSEDNELVITGMGLNASMASTAINGAFVIPEAMAYNSGVNFGAALAYLIQTTATAANPTWSWGSVDDCSTAIATFKAAAAGGGTFSDLVNGGLANCGLINGGLAV